MRFSLQDVKKSVQRRDGELFVSLHFLRPGELHEEIARLIAYHDDLLDQPQRNFSLDDARSYIGDYRLAHCLIATLSHWYSWRQREWAAALQTLTGSPDLADITSSVQLRQALYDYVNQNHQGFLGEQGRYGALQAFAANYQLDVADLEYLLALDSDDEALLVRTTPQAPSVQDVATVYNQWVFEAALFNASSVSFVIDCQAFSKKVAQASSATIGTGMGAVIKRLSYLARKLGVYYDLTYDTVNKVLPGEGVTLELPGATSPLLTLTLYGPQEVTGAPQQYGLRLARLCRLLLGYGIAHAERGQARSKGKTLLAAAIVEAGAKIHFLQRTYNFAIFSTLKRVEDRYAPSQPPARNNIHTMSENVKWKRTMDSHILKFIEAPEEEASQNNLAATSQAAATLFDSSIEQFFRRRSSLLRTVGAWMAGNWSASQSPCCSLRAFLSPISP